MAGFGTIRKCQKGYKIGPLLGDDKKIAEALFIALNNSIPENFHIFLDIPEINKSALQMATDYQMKFVFETARMYTKSAPKLSMDKIFGITTFELG